jgi:hypothetical protein
LWNWQDHFGDQAPAEGALTATHVLSFVSCAQIFFDKRANSNLHLLTVNETAPEENIDDKDHLNAMQPLAIEATMINQNFSQQVGWVRGWRACSDCAPFLCADGTLMRAGLCRMLKTVLGVHPVACQRHCSPPCPAWPASMQVLVKGGDKFKYEQPNPFVSPDDDEELASCAYRWASKQADTRAMACGQPLLKAVISSMGLSHAFVQMRMHTSSMLQHYAQICSNHLAGCHCSFLDKLFCLSLRWELSQPLPVVPYPPPAGTASGA